LDYTFVLIDEPLENDQRVLSSINQCINPIIIDCSKLKYKKKNSILIFLYNLQSFCYSLLFSFSIWRKLRTYYHIKPIKFLSGLVASMKIKYEMENFVVDIIEKHKSLKINTIYANDLACGLLGMKLAKYFNAKLIYDAHEIEFHRNRKNSFLRVVYDILLEKEIVKTAQKVIVVNQPIKKLYMDIYNIPESKIAIVDNNHFIPYMGYALNHFSNESREVVVTYVGGGIFGRKLEDLAKEASKADVEVYGFFLANTPKVANEQNWHLGSKDYLPELLDLSSKTHLVMWCCTEDVCLSYRLSLPNKFFQAMAIGIPVIAYKGTYLADIVAKYDLGYIYDDDNFQVIIKQLKDRKKYYALLESIASFQQKLFNNELEL